MKPVSVRVLRWVYSRAGTQLTCELTLDDNAVLYELHLYSNGRPSTKPLEKFGDVSKAFAWQCHMEGTLLDDGWTLDRYESAIERPIRAH